MHILAGISKSFVSLQLRFSLSYILEALTKMTYASELLLLLSAVGFAKQYWMPKAPQLLEIECAKVIQSALAQAVHEKS